jgi:hypothetical protein
VPLTREAYVAEQREQGVPEEWVQLSVDLYEQIRSGGLASVTAHVRRVLDRFPQDFSEYAETAAAQGAWRT